MKTDQQPKHSLVMPRAESRKWSLLGKCLYTIHTGIDAAIHTGYCKRNARKLDSSLSSIIAAAAEAQAILRREAGSSPRDVETMFSQIRKAMANGGTLADVKTRTKVLDALK